MLNEMMTFEGVCQARAGAAPIKISEKSRLTARVAMQNACMADF